jgi:hypothetical protein
MYETPFMFEKGKVEHGRIAETISPTINSIHNMFYDCINPSTRRLCPYPNLRTHYIDYRFSVEGKKVMEMWKNRDQQIRELINLFSTGKISKQISAITNATTRAALQNYIAFAISSIPLGTIHDHSSVIIMDIYGIARMLRQFDKRIDKHNSQFKGTSDNIIYYSGAAHVINMRLFFTKFMKLNESPINVLWDEKSVDTCGSFMKLDIGNKALNFV